MKKRLMLVDAHNQFLRSYIVDPSLSTNGNPIGGVKGFLKILNKLTREISPDLIFLIWDGPGGSKKRKSADKGYKKGRTPPRPRLNRVSNPLTQEQEVENKIWQQSKLIEILNHTPVIQFLEPGVEADDIISYVRSHSKFSSWEKVIVSSDKDFYQTLDNKTILYRPTQSEVLTEKRVLEKHGIHPTNFALARALCGDKSDNLPGISGVGLKTVANKFPFLGTPETCYVDDLIDFAKKEAENSNLKIYQRVGESKSLIEHNYKMMQLYSPLLSSSLKTKITMILDNYQPEFNKTSLRKETIREGFGEVTLNDLFTNFNSTISNFSLFF